jgi:hypothetical protein
MIGLILLDSLFISSTFDTGKEKLTVNLDFLAHYLLTTLFKISRSTTLDHAGTDPSFRFLRYVHFHARLCRCVGGLILAVLDQLILIPLNPKFLIRINDMSPIRFFGINSSICCNFRSRFSFSLVNYSSAPFHNSGRGRTFAFCSFFWVCFIFVFFIFLF